MAWNPVAPHVSVCEKMPQNACSRARLRKMFLYLQCVTEPRPPGSVTPVDFFTDPSVRGQARCIRMAGRGVAVFDSIGNWLEGWRVVQQIGIAYLLTALIGWNREREAHTTGIRTFPIVGIASCGYILALGSQPDVAAQSRVLQGLITGIGFIGGGAILKEGATVKGTATAASIWNAGVIGASVAMNHYGIAIVLSLFNLFTLRVLLPLKQKLDKD
jgi:putative Mg2+ transporter-C (MgtC) family protein